ncbi:hypothetical protein [Halomonas sp. BC1]|uniref:hypothetical protein n=1 Tax=Halomonas sp. BC1 TaxID=1670448 RepID=UPI00111AED1A|nr:hypothetical protein [Halomonas sp. BC1]
MAGIKEAEQHVRALGGSLVIRAHTHADYCTDIVPPEQDTLTRLLDPFFDIKHLVTIRNPIDSFLSLQDNGWVHFEPATFDEYCYRLFKFLNFFEASDIVCYEDFVSEPRKLTSRCAEILDIPVNNLAHDYIDIFNISGDSGRSGSEIMPRSRKYVSDEYMQDIIQSISFKELCKRYDIQPLSE